VPDEGRCLSLEIPAVGRRVLCDDCLKIAHGAAGGVMYRLQPYEFVYTCEVLRRHKREPWEPEDLRWWAHRIIRRTKKGGMWVTRECIRAEDGGTAREDRSRLDGRLYYRIDARDLDRQGWARHPPFTASAFYRAADMPRVASPGEMKDHAAGWDATGTRRWTREEWECLRRESEASWRGILGAPAARPRPEDDAVTLGVPWPCSLEQLKDAYRRLSKAMHPDVGATAEGFRRVNEAYERITRLV
jgi:hypothetical protein